MAAACIQFCGSLLYFLFTHRRCRMYGEPGDAFHDRYTEGNFAYRAGLQYCHCAIRLTKDKSCSSIAEPDCAGAFHHIGGGRGTRPMNARGSACEDFGWNFFGTVSDCLSCFTSRLRGKFYLTAYSAANV